MAGPPLLNVYTTPKPSSTRRTLITGVSTTLACWEVMDLMPMKKNRGQISTILKYAQIQGVQIQCMLKMPVTPTKKNSLQLEEENPGFKLNVFMPVPALEVNQVPITSIYTSPILIAHEISLLVLQECGWEEPCSTQIQVSKGRTTHAQSVSASTLIIHQPGRTTCGRSIHSSSTSLCVHVT